ncbi:unnamed protein product [Rhizoctonia solani]|uniref:Uncharacterized protein n=1 Tax=Rhizoctonia solani TaxID=456999 RepID=A0A8H3BBU6_9AGAM|nr:unnamed protein product [Rhizoctonia solani]
MSSFAGKTPIASSIHSDRAIPPARSNTETSYPDYAPPSYEAVTAISAPSTVSRPESFAVIEDEEPCTEPIERNAKSIPLRDPLDPMPPCFSWNPLLNTPYEALSQPFAVHAKPGKKFLDDAFEIVGTNLLENHDVCDRDWDRLLQDIQTVARLTKGQRIAARVLPVTMYMGCTGFFVSRAIERGMKRKKAASVNALLDVWNERFFRPRHLEITLWRGDRRVPSAPGGDEAQCPAPDRQYVQPRRKRCCGARKTTSCAFKQVDNNSDQHSTCWFKKEVYRLVVVSV